VRVPYVGLAVASPPIRAGSQSPGSGPQRHRVWRPGISWMDPYFRGRVLDQYSVNAVSSLFRSHSAMSLSWKARSPCSRSRLSNSVISPAVLGFLILFNAREMCSPRRRFEFGIFFIWEGEFSRQPPLPGLEEDTRKGKGCDIGYALAASSCEGANSMEACTVTALDAITAFAVPNPNCPSQSRRFFQVWLLFRLPRRADHSAYFGLAKV
jgi:hypothetical protein